MGARLVEYYAEAESLGGVQAKIKLAMSTRVPSTRAQTEPDSPANLRSFESAMRALRAELKQKIDETGPGTTLTELQTLRERVKNLEGTEEWLWGVLSSLHDAVVIAFDRAGTCVLAWDSKSLAKRYLGSPRTTLAESLPQRVASQLAAEHGDAIRQVFADGQVRNAEYPFVVEGATYWHAVSFSPMIDAKGSCSAVVAFVRDVTSRKESEERLRQSENRLRRHQDIYLELMSQKSSFLGDLGQTCRRITESAAGALEVARASVWFYDPARTKIACFDLFESAERRHSSGLELPAQSFPQYFASLEEERTIDADDAQTDPRTCEFTASYLSPLGITSMLDVPIWANGRMIGVVCHEHIGPARTWAAEEESFAYMMANFVAIAVERAGAPRLTVAPRESVAP